MSFKPFKLSHEEKGQWVRFVPSASFGPGMVHVRFQGACGHVMENVITEDDMVRTVADLLAKGYLENS